MKEDDFDVDEYIKQCEEEDKKLSQQVKELKFEKFELSEEDKKLATLENQILKEREKEDEFVKTLSPKKRKEYLDKKYLIVDQLADLSGVKKVTLKSPKGGK